MLSRFHLYAGIVIAGLLLGTVISRHAGPNADQPNVLASMNLPDLDQDKKPERLWVTPRDAGGYWIKLDSSAGAHTHDLVWLDAPPPFRFEGGDNRWRMRDGMNRVVLDVRTYMEKAPIAPDLMVFGGGTAVRYHWIDRGFMKLMPTTIVPGYSVGLVMLDDPRPLIELMGGPVGPDGGWVAPLPDPLHYNLAFKKDRVSAIGFDSPRFAIQNGMHPGTPAADFTKVYAGEQHGNRYFSPRYGLIADISGTKTIAHMTVVWPWTEKKVSPRLQPKGVAQHVRPAHH